MFIPMFNKNATIIEYPSETRSRDGSVDIMTTLQTGLMVQFPARTNHIPVPQYVQTSSATHPATLYDSRH